MSVKSRIKALEKRTGQGRGILILRVAYPDDYEGEVPEGCYRKSELPPLGPVGPKDMVLTIDLSAATAKR